VHSICKISKRHKWTYWNETWKTRSYRRKKWRHGHWQYFPTWNRNMCITFSLQYELEIVILHNRSFLVEKLWMFKTWMLLLSLSLGIYIKLDNLYWRRKLHFRLILCIRERMKCCKWKLRFDAHWTMICIEERYFRFNRIALPFVDLWPY
jgi:hypothetical protein